MIIYRLSKSIAKASITALLLSLFSACSGGTEGTGLGTPVTLEGVVSAPGGAIAFNKPDLWQRMFSGVFGKSAVAAITGVVNVGAGITVNLIEVDASGNQVGGIIASGTTNAAGVFSIEPPTDFSAGSQYVIRALGMSENMDARVASTTVNVNPITDAASQLVTAKISDLGKISTTELQEFVSTVNNLSKDIEPGGLTAQGLSAAMQTEVVNDSASNNIINSAAATGEICGKVSNATGAGISDIHIVARDYGDWVTRATTSTANDGRYCLNVPKAGDPDSDTGSTFNGQYILGAINRTNDTNGSASEWWSAGGAAYSQFVAEKITVTDTTTPDKNFQLENGARISGVISDAGSGSGIEGVYVIVRSFESLAPVASARTDTDGTYSINLIAGTYAVEARNTTTQAFASEVYDGVNGSNNSNNGIPVTMATGQNKTINFALVAGNKLSGVITNGTGGSAVTGQRVLVNLAAGGSSVRLRTNNIGYYRVWLLPDIYTIFAYGQSRFGVDLTASDQTVNFLSENVSSITARVLYGNVPVSQAKVRLYDNAGAFIGNEPTSSDGTVTVYTTGIGNHFIEARIDAPADYGTIIYDNHTRLLSGVPINVASLASTVPVGDITLPSGGILTGKVTTNDVTPIPNFRVAVRDDNNLSGNSGGVLSTDIFTSMRTRGDGSYVVTLPAGIYDRVKMQDASLGVVNDNGNCDTVTIIAGATTTVNYNNGTDTCF